MQPWLGEQLAQFFDAEDIVAKLNALNLIEGRYRYEQTVNEPLYWNRLRRAVRTLPEEFQAPATALFSNVLYITNDILAECMRTVALELCEYGEGHKLVIPDDAHIFAIDHPGLADTLYRVGGEAGWRGRQDNIALRTIRSLSDFLESLECLSQTTDSGTVGILREVASKPLWVLLTDNTLSGGSLRTDLGRLLALKEHFNPGASVVVGALVITVQARDSISKSYANTHVFYGLQFDDTFRIHLPSCRLFHNASVQEEVIRLCETFANEFFADLPLAPSDSISERIQEPLKPTLALHRALGYRSNFAFGWADGGYTIVLQGNCPTNTVPPLWYPILGGVPAAGLRRFNGYVPPFPRNHSRYKQVTAGDEARLNRVLARADELQKLLRP